MARFEKLEFEQPPQARVSPETLPHNAEELRSWVDRAHDSRRLGAYEGALRYYSRALEEDKSLVSCWVGQVQMLIQLGEYPEAELWSRKALELFPNNGELLASRAQALCRSRKKREGLAAIDQSLQQTGQSAYRWMVRGELLVASGQATDRHCFDKALQCDNDWLTPIEIGLIYLHYGQPSNALARARLALERDSSAPYAWYVIGRCQHGLGMNAAARQSLNSCLELKSDFREAQELLPATDASGSLWKFMRRLWIN